MQHAFAHLLTAYMLLINDIRISTVRIEFHCTVRFDMMQFFLLGFLSFAHSPHHFCAPP